MSQSTQEIQEIEDERNSAEMSRFEEIQEDEASAYMENMRREMVAKLQQLGSLSEEVSIFRVPYKLRNVKNEAYTPNIVSIGPFHQGNETVAAMEEQKWHYMRYFFQRVEDDQQSLQCLEECTEAIHGLDARIRRMYAEKISCEAHALAQMMLLDGCFTLELLLRYDQQLNSNSSVVKSDPIFRNVWMIPALRHDLLLLENQIPFCVLESLYNAINPSLCGTEEQPRSVAALALKFFHPLSQKEITTQEPSTVCNHLLDLLYKFYFLPAADVRSTSQRNNTNLTAENSNHSLPTTQSSSLPLTRPTRSRTRRNSMYAIRETKAIKYGAADLLTCGMQIINESAGVQLLNITFRDGKITIPPLLIGETTDSLFRNLIALEQCSLRSPLPVTSYVILMCSLIRSPLDILRLSDKKILIKHKGNEGQKLVLKNEIIINDNEIGGHEFYTNLKGMLDQVVVKEFYFKDLCDQVNAVTGGWYLLSFISFRRRFFRQQVNQTDLDLRFKVMSFVFQVISVYISLVAAVYTLGKRPGVFISPSPGPSGSPAPTGP